MDLIFSVSAGATVLAGTTVHTATALWTGIMVITETAIVLRTLGLHGTTLIVCAVSDVNYIVIKESLVLTLIVAFSAS